MDKVSEALFSNPRRVAKLFLSCTAIAGTVMLLRFFQSPSEEGSQFVLGLSPVRLALGGLLTLLWALNVLAFFAVSRKADPSAQFGVGKLSVWIVEYLGLAYFAIGAIALSMAILLICLLTPVIQGFIFLEPMRARLTGPVLWLFFSSLLMTVLLRISYKERIRDTKLASATDRFLILAGIFLATFFFYELLLTLTGTSRQSGDSYWNLLANEFIKGNLHLENPRRTFDLTLYNGKWYVPMPPFPAILMMPLAYMFGGENINGNDFSIALCAFNALLLALILEQFARRNWINLSRFGMFLLVLLFAFGTPHLWVGTQGRVWFISQIVTVTFVAIAVLAALRFWSPWWVGVSLGAAIATRPNVIMTWPFLFAIAMQILSEQGSVSWRRATDWALRSIVPVVLTVSGLLFYNYARFGNLLDFGYATVSGNPVVVANAQRYGIFAPHFIPANIKAMFLNVPSLRLGDKWPIAPSISGMSMFLVTPPLVYLFRSYEKKWWILGAWASIIMTFILLLLYHNTGAGQFGYRYILDAIVPLIAMLAVALGRSIPWHFGLLLLCSFVANIYGLYWFVNR